VGHDVVVVNETVFRWFTDISTIYSKYSFICLKIETVLRLGQSGQKTAAVLAKTSSKK
jgi:hypothetical protein